MIVDGDSIRPAGVGEVRIGLAGVVLAQGFAYCDLAPGFPHSYCHRRLSCSESILRSVEQPVNATGNEPENESKSKLKSLSYRLVE